MFFAWACQGNSCKIMWCWFIFLLVSQTTSLEDGQLGGFCVTFCPLFLQLLLLQTCIDWPPAPPPPCPLLVSPDHLPCLRLLNSIFHLQDKRHLFPTRGERERTSAIKHQVFQLLRSSWLQSGPTTEVLLCPSWFLSTFIFCRICWTSFRMRWGRMPVLIQ